MKFALAFIICAYSLANDCKVLENDLRIDHREDLKALEGVCETKGRLALLLDDATDVELPALRKASFIIFNSDSVRTVGFPNLETAGKIHFEGKTLEAVRLEGLKQAGGFFVVKAPELSSIKTAKLESIDSLWIDGTPHLDLTDLSALEKVSPKYSPLTALMSPGEYYLWMNPQEEIPSTGHPTYFGIPKPISPIPGYYPYPY